MKNILWFTTGAIAGAVLGITVYKKMYDESNDAKFDDEIDAIREEVKDDFRKQLEKNEVIEKEEDEPVEEDPQPKKRDYSRLSKDLGYGQVSKPEVVVEDAYIISSEQFYEECQEHDKLTITYYAYDTTLADEDEAIMHDVTGTVGDEALFNFGYRSDDDNVVYVRNEKLGIDYEVVRTMASYSEEVLGIEVGEMSKKDRVRGDAS